MARQKSIDGDQWLEQRAFDKKSQKIRSCYYSLRKKQCIWNKPPKGVTVIHRWIKSNDIDASTSLSRGKQTICYKNESEEP
jgi:phosphoribosyl-AMP cyclohydrolase